MNNGIVTLLRTEKMSKEKWNLNRTETEKSGLTNLRGRVLLFLIEKHDFLQYYICERKLRFE